MPVVEHTLPPIWSPDSRVLILGSLPSVASRQQGFYYAHPQNRFWAVLAGVFNCPVPVGVEQKTAFLHAHRLALWDVIAQCTIRGSSDASIQNAQPNDLRPILQGAKIACIVANGKTAARLYNRLIWPSTGRPCTALPSTSPANASWRLEALIQAYRCIDIDKAQHA